MKVLPIVNENAYHASTSISVYGNTNLVPIRSHDTFSMTGSLRQALPDTETRDLMFKQHPVTEKLLRCPNQPGRIVAVSGEVSVSVFICIQNGISPKELHYSTVSGVSDTFQY